MKSFIIILWAVTMFGGTARIEASTLTMEEANLTADAARKCTGGYYRDRLHDVHEIVASLPKAAESSLAVGKDRANDIYVVAKGLLLPALVNPKRALDGGKQFLTCPAAPEAGLALMRFVAGDSPAERIGPINSIHWLAEAYRQGVGVPADQSVARQLFLKARVMGQFLLTAEDWGTSTNDRLEDILNRDENLALLEQAAETQNPEAQMLLGQQLIGKDNNRAHKLLGLAAQHGRPAATDALAEAEWNGSLGQRNAVHAIQLWASIAWPWSKNQYYERTMRSILHYNRLGEVIPVARTLRFNEIGGKALLPKPGEIELDAILQPVNAKALVDPEGQIILVELIDRHLYSNMIGAATRKIYEPKKLAKVSPHLVEGRPVYAWMTLPRVNFARTGKQVRLWIADKDGPL